MVSANSSGDEAIAHFVKKAIDFGATEIEVAGLRRAMLFCFTWCHEIRGRWPDSRHGGHCERDLKIKRYLDET